MFNFVSKLQHAVKRFGYTANRGFNTIKNHARNILPTIRKVAGMIKDGAGLYSTLPVVGHVASTIGQVASTIYHGAGMAEGILEQTDIFQREVGLDTSLPIPNS